MKFFLAIVFCFSVLGISAQPFTKIDSVKFKNLTPEIFTSGFIDIMNNGQMNASARFIRLNIGEPGKFYIPLSIYGGVSNNSFGSAASGSFALRNNDQLYNQYINPLGGLINISIDGIAYSSRLPKVTRAGLLYQFGERVLTGYRSGPITSPQSGKPVNFLNSFANAGFYFQTGAWERNNAKNVGMFWMACRYIACKSNSKSITEILPDTTTNGFYTGYSVGFGVEINNLVNIKAIFYRYIKKPETMEYNQPVYQFTFNYAFKN